MNTNARIKSLLPTKKTAILAVAFFFAGTVHAQSHGNHLMLDIGASYPRGLKTAIAYEHTYNLYYGWSVFFQIKEDIIIRGKDTFRTGATIGVKIPL